MTTKGAASTGFGRRAAVMITPYVAGAVATGIAFLLFKGSFPDEIATHFTLDGTADGFHPPASAIGLFLLIFGIEAAGSAGALFSVKSPRMVGSFGVFSWGLAAATTYLFVVVMQASTDLDGGDVQLPLYQLAIAVATGVVAGIVAWLTSRRNA